MNCILFKLYNWCEELLKGMSTFLLTQVTCMRSDERSNDLLDLLTWLVHSAFFVLHFFHPFPLSYDFLCLVSTAFSITVIFLFLSSSLLLSAFFPPLLAFSVGESYCCQIFKAAPCALFPLHLHALMSLEQHTEPTNLQTCLAGILHDGLMRCVVVVRCSCFLTNGESQSRERFGSFVGLILLLCGGVGSVRYTLSCCCVLLPVPAVSLFLLPSTFLSSVALHPPFPSLFCPSFVCELMSAWWKQEVRIHFFKSCYKKILLFIHPMGNVNMVSEYTLYK